MERLSCPQHCKYVTSIVSFHHRKAWWGGLCCHILWQLKILQQEEMPSGPSPGLGPGKRVWAHALGLAVQLLSCERRHSKDKASNSAIRGPHMWAKYLLATQLVLINNTRWPWLCTLFLPLMYVDLVRSHLFTVHICEDCNRRHVLQVELYGALSL